jgi:hypothetical protein
MAMRMSMKGPATRITRVCNDVSPSCHSSSAATAPVAVLHPWASALCRSPAGSTTSSTAAPAARPSLSSWSRCSLAPPSVRRSPQRCPSRARHLHHYKQLHRRRPRVRLTHTATPGPHRRGDAGKEMVRRNVGVDVRETHEVKRIDEDFFQGE